VLYLIKHRCITVLLYVEQGYVLQQRHAKAAFVFCVHVSAQVRNLNAGAESFNWYGRPQYAAVMLQEEVMSRLYVNVR
jgi:hypothetical protein